MVSNYPDSTWEGDPMAPWNQDPYEEEPEDDGTLELTPVEKLAIAQAFYNSVGKMVNTKDPDNLRGQVNAYFERVFDATGAKSFDVKLLGEKVGTYSITVSKAKAPEVHYEVAVENWDEFELWAQEHGYAYVEYDMEAINRGFDRTGEIPPGCKTVAKVTPAVEGGKISRTALKVDADAVMDAIGPKLEAASTLLLEGVE